MGPENNHGHSQTLYSYSVCVIFLVQELLKRAVSKTEGYEVHQLEKLYALLCQSIYRHRKNFDKTELVQVCDLQLMTLSRPLL